MLHYGKVTYFNNYKTNIAYCMESCRSSYTYDIDFVCLFFFQYSHLTILSHNVGKCNLPNNLGLTYIVYNFIFYLVFRWIYYINMNYLCFFWNYCRNSVAWFVIIPEFVFENESYKRYLLIFVKKYTWMKFSIFLSSFVFNKVIKYFKEESDDIYNLHLILLV